MNHQQKIDIVARLLATENLTIVRKNTQTASFDTKHRVLTLPILKDGTSEVVEDMMTCHEVGHAKHTTDAAWQQVIQKPPLDQYFNVVEDVRVENLMKQEFPGVAKSLRDGYGELNKMDFFGVKKSGKKWDEFNLIDRINLYFKVGHDCGVQFTEEEKKFVERAEKTKTVKEALKLAEDILKFTKEPYQPPPQKPQMPKKGDKVKAKRSKNGSGNGQPLPEGVEIEWEDDEDEDGDGDGAGEKQEGKADKDGEDGQGSGKGDKEGKGEGQGEGEGQGQGEGEEGEGGGNGGQPDKSGKDGGDSEQTSRGASRGGSGGQAGTKPRYGYTEVSTQETFNGMMKKLATNNDRYEYFSVNPNYTRPPIVPFKKVIQETASVDNYVKNQRSTIDDMKYESKLSINYMLKEFEMKKSAEVHKRVQESKTGMLASNKLFAYKLKDDLFRRVSIIPKGKNHGMIFLLDWSGSMSGTIDQAVRQMVDLASFCRRAQMPFEVYAFSSAYQGAYTHNTPGKNQQSTKPVHGTNWFPNGDGGFNLLQFLSYEMTTKEFNLMVDRLLTGQITKARGYSLGGTPLNEALSFFVGYLDKFKKKHMLEKLSFVTMTDGDGTPLSYGSTFTKGFVTDPITKKNYQFISTGPSQTHMLLQIMQDRYNCKTVGYHIMDSEHQLGHAIGNFGYDHSSVLRTTVAQCSKELKEFGACFIPSPSRDAMFAVTNNSMRYVKTTMSVSSSQTADQASRELTRAMQTRKLNRVVLERFITTIA